MHWIAVTWITAVLSVVLGNITVIQSPESLIKMPGQTARLSCTYQGPSAIGGYTWHRGNTRGNEVSNSTPEFRDRVLAASQEDFRVRRDASICIIDLKPEDTGFYVCKVAFMGMGEAYGAGTTVIVTRGNNGSSKAESKSTTSTFVIAVTVMVPLLIIIVMIVVKSCRKTATLQQPESSDPLYAEMHEGETNYVRSECRRTNRGDDGVQYAEINVQEGTRWKRPVDKQTMVYAKVKNEPFIPAKDRQRAIDVMPEDTP
ncbi:uncharacterized protein LOC122541165 isoform X2 [Chiloscyllium plagiosum]|uniref:uncharacterized protein LOC122541165 isoform X2 n=1 Tax=Chiloscyllium plagiosum TaxID=36176 RepID=UPI001CB7C35F|nr:uncharacterized protein LOC122541165 isoform X2 [Chiloscyllium plagiosum]